MKAPGAAGAGVEPEDAVPFLLQIPVGMAEYHRVNAGEVRREFFPVVNQIEGHAAKGDGQVVGDGLCPVLVVVARTT